MEGEISISIDKEKLNSDTKWDGLKGYITNTNLCSKEILENYNNLWKIEKAFRISKTDLKIRPIYHRLKERVETHICISFMAYLVFKELERSIHEYKCTFSISEAINQINKMYEIKLNEPPFQKIIRLKNNELQSQILSILNHEF